MADSSAQSVRSAPTEVHSELEKKASDVDPFQVRFTSDEPEYPKSWSKLRRWYLTMVAGLLVLNATFSSSAPASVIPLLQQEFGFGKEIGTLTISLFVCGYCVGPLLWAPLSEQYGRRPIFILTFFTYMCFQIGCALSQNTASILVFRFLGGTFAAAPLSNAGALISDIWGPKERGVAMAIFSVAPFAGPGIGPIVGGYLYDANVSWRWVFWILAIFAGVCLLLIILTIPETYEPILLVKRARNKRKQTGDERYFAPMELQSTAFRDRVEVVLARPFKIFFLEPMLFVVTIYMSFIYGCLYLLFEAYPIVYMEGHHLKAGPGGLVYLPLPIGGFLAVFVYIIYFNPQYVRKAEELAPEPVPPEFRLRVAMISAPSFAVAFFWFAWTSFPSVSIWAPLASALVLGFSICFMFLGLINYIIDVYLAVAASALAATTVVRSLFGAAFPLFASQMYAKLGPEWASSLLGFIALAMTPVPFVLSKYGPAIRAKSRYAPYQPTKSIIPK